VKIARLTGCKNLVGKRKFTFNAFVDLKLTEVLRMGVTCVDDNQLP